MAHNGVHPALSPTITSSTSEPFQRNLLSSSISSLSSSTTTRHPSQVTKTYRQSSTLFLTRRLPEALSTILPLVTPPEPISENEPAPVAVASRGTRIKVWSLYLTILNAIVELEPDEGKDAFGAQEWRALCNKIRDGSVWEEVVQNGYHGVEGDVDADVVINLATLLLAHARDQILNQKRLEAFLASSNTPSLDLSGRLSESRSPGPRAGLRAASKGRSGANTPRDLNARVKILELYTLHVLLRNNEWDYAREFISVSSVLDDERREAFLQALQSLQEEQQEEEKREAEERQRQEEQLRKDVEIARRLRAENEEKERKRLEEERLRRGEGSEMDYGVDDTSSIAGSTRSRSSKVSSKVTRNPAPSSHQPPPRAAPHQRASSKGQNKSQVSKPLTIKARATKVYSRLRAILYQLGTTLNTNPMFLMRLLAFVMGIILMFGHRGIRERVQRLLGSSWTKVKATAGMGTKVSYI